MISDFKKIGFKNLIAHKNYLKLLIANAISRFGDSIDSIAFAWMIYILTGSNVLMGSILAINALPNILFSPFAGTLVDKYSKKKIIIITHIGRGIIVLITALLYFLGMLKPWHLFILTFINSTFETLNIPAVFAIMPSLVDKELFLTANSFSKSLYKLMGLIGISIAGGIIATIGVSGAIMIDGITFAIAAMVTFFIKVTEKRNNNINLDFKTYIKEVGAGFKYVKKNHIIIISIVLFAVVNFAFGPINVLMPHFVKYNLQSDAKMLSILSLALIVGEILGGIIVGQFCSKVKKILLVILSIFFLGLNYSLLFIPGNLYLFNNSSIVFSIISFFGIGFFLIFAISSLTAYLLENVSEEFLGRTSSFINMVSGSMTPLGMFLCGIVAHYISISLIFLTMGLMISIVSVILFLRKPIKIEN
ncbi:MFS transporter [Dethiothermospora halolimnae]|uniref:MFS transporter n=1 Tax=Dethiothermospora halolimnae TaxID=3114390 RepID=UPI003CCC0578